MTARRLGVEEELLLADTATGQPRPVAMEVIQACGSPPDAGDGPQIKHEFFLSQLEVASRPHTDVTEIRGDLIGGRTRVAQAGAAVGVVPLAVPGPVLAVPSSSADEFSPGERYGEIERHYGHLARQSLMCALHVHVEVVDDEEGVAVIDRMRPWVPLLIAISANSPYWHGRAMGYDSWRNRIWNMWPTSGPAELFGDAATYHSVVRDLVSGGGALDEGLVNVDVRLSRHYPTVEFRAADVCTDVDDAVLVAALVRALVTYCAEQWRAGCPAAPWRVDELRTAAWRAARFGLGEGLVSPVSRTLTSAGEVLSQLLHLLAEPLERAGDVALVTRGVTTLAERGNGATRQRAVFAAGGDLAAVVADLRRRTLG